MLAGHGVRQARRLVPCAFSMWWYRIMIAYLARLPVGGQVSNVHATTPVGVALQ